MKYFAHSVGKREEDDSSALDVMWGSFAHFSGMAAFDRRGRDRRQGRRKSTCDKVAVRGLRGEHLQGREPVRRHTAP